MYATFLRMQQYGSDVELVIEWNFIKLMQNMRSIVQQYLPQYISRHVLGE